MNYISFDQIPAYISIVTRKEMNIHFLIAVLKEKANTKGDCSKEQAECQAALAEFNDYVENVSTRLENLKLSDESERIYARKQAKKMREVVNFLANELKEELRRIQRGVWVNFSNLLADYCLLVVYIKNYRNMKFI